MYRLFANQASQKAKARLTRGGITRNNFEYAPYFGMSSLAQPQTAHARVA